MHGCPAEAQMLNEVDRPRIYSSSPTCIKPHVMCSYCEAAEHPLKLKESMKKYNVIYADPAWSYSDKRTGAGKNNPNGAGGALKHYSTMDTNSICNLPIKELADDNCMLFLWATSPLMPDALKVMEAWGFKYKTVGFVWAKTTNDGMKIRGDGIGNYTIQNAEFCLIGLKGKYWRNKTGVKQFILSPKQKHSQKPNDAKNRIVELCGDLPRIELFARQETNGWDVWGNEVESSVAL